MIERNINPIDPSVLDDRIRVVLVAPHPIQRTQLTQLILTYKDLDVVGVAVNGQDVMRLCPHVRPDVVVVDPRGGGLDSLDLTTQIQNCWSWIQILVLGDETEGQEGLPVEGVKDGGPLPGGTLRRHLGATIRTLYAQRKGGPQWNGAGPRLRAFPDQILNRREWEVWQALKMGLTDVQIGQQLGVNELTARLHVRNVLDHLGLPSREDAVEVEKRDPPRSRRPGIAVPLPERRQLAANVRPASLDLAYRHVMGMESVSGRYR